MQPFHQTPTDPATSTSSVHKNGTGEWETVENLGYTKEILRIVYTFNGNIPPEGNVQILRTLDGHITLFNHMDYPHAIRIENLGAEWRVSYADIPSRPLKIKKELALEMSEQDIEELRAKHQFSKTLAN